MTDVKTVDEYVEMAKDYEILGPAYFDARDVAARITNNFSDEHFEPMIKEFTDKFYSQISQSMQDHLMSDVTCNLQNEVRRMVEYSIEALLSGKDWAIKRYVMQEYDQEGIRSAIAKHIPEELQNKLLYDLQKENIRLKDDLIYYRTHQS